MVCRSSIILIFAVITHSRDSVYVILTLEMGYRLGCWNNGMDWNGMVEWTGTGINDAAVVMHACCDYIHAATCMKSKTIASRT